MPKTTANITLLRKLHHAHKAANLGCQFCCVREYAGCYRNSAKYHLLSFTDYPNQLLNYYPKGFGSLHI